MPSITGIDLKLCIRERDLQRQIKLTKDQLRDLRASNENNQEKLLNQSERQGKLNASAELTVGRFVDAWSKTRKSVLNSLRWICLRQISNGQTDALRRLNDEMYVLPGVYPFSCLTISSACRNFSEQRSRPFVVAASLRTALKP